MITITSCASVQILWCFTVPRFIVLIKLYKVGWTFTIPLINSVHTKTVMSGHPLGKNGLNTSLNVISFVFCYLEVWDSPELNQRLLQNRGNCIYRQKRGFKELYWGNKVADKIVSFKKGYFFHSLNPLWGRSLEYTTSSWVCPVHFLFKEGYYH